MKFFPLGAIVVIKNICKRINIHHQAARKYVKYNLQISTIAAQHNNHNISAQHFMDTTIIPTIYKEDRDQCHQALPCYVIDLWHKLCCKYWGTTAVHWGQLRHWQTTIIK